MDKLAMIIQGLGFLKAENFDDITLETSVDELGLDSLDLVELQLYLEENFNIETQDPSKPVLTVKDILELF